MYSNRLFTPLRYPGGKAKFAPFISDVMKENKLAGGHYLEPYAGGAGVALDLLFSEVASHIHINDADPALYNFWTSAVFHTDSLIKLIENTPINMEQWHHWRAVLRGEVERVSIVESGFATLFMNRTNRSGILKAGVIGGQAQSGGYKLDARFKKDVIIGRIQKISEYSDNISVYNEDALSLLDRCEGFLPKQSLIYLDPPYYVKGQGLYRNFYEHEDHLNIANKLQSKEFTRPWIVSYDAVQEIKTMYRRSSDMSYGLYYTAQERYVGEEIMFFSKNLNLKNVGPISSQKAA